MADENASEHDETCGCVYCRDARWAEDRAEDGVEMGAMIQATTGTTPKLAIETRSLPGPERDMDARIAREIGSRDPA